MSAIMSAGEHEEKGDYGNRSELMLRIEQGPTEDRAFEYLQSNASLTGERLNDTDRWGNTAIHYCAIWGAHRTAALLLERGCDARIDNTQKRKDDGSTENQIDYHGAQTPLDLAAVFGQEKVLQILLDSVDFTREEFKKALEQAAKRGEIPQALFKKSADGKPRYTLKTLMSALVCAVARGHASAMLFLLGRVPLDREFDDEAAEAFQDAGVETGGGGGGGGERRTKGLAGCDTLGEALMQLAIRAEFYDLVDHLIRAGAQPGLQTIPITTVLQPEKLGDEFLLGETPLARALRLGKHASEGKQQLRAFRQALSMLPVGFLGAPGTTMLAALYVSEAVDKASKRWVVLDPLRARRLKRIGVEAQLTAVMLLGTLEEERQSDLLESFEGEEFLRKATRLEAAPILSHPIVQQKLRSRWFGPLLIAVLRGYGVGAWGDKVPLKPSEASVDWGRLQLVLLLLLVIVPLNLLVLPLVAVVPPIEGSVLRWLRTWGTRGERHGQLRKSGYSKRFRIWWECLWLLDVPFFKAWIHHAFNLSFGVIVVAQALPTPLLIAWSAMMMLMQLNRLTFQTDNVFIKWPAWALLLSSAFIGLSLTSELLPGVLPAGENASLVAATDEVAETVRGFTGVGVLFLFVQIFASIFLQSAFFGPMVISITQMIGDTFIWLMIFMAAVGSFTLSLLVKDPRVDTNAYEQISASDILRYLFNLGLKVSPLLGASPLIRQGQQDPMEYFFLQFFFMVVSVMLYSMLIALFSTRLVKDENSRIPAFHKSFSKLVFNEHLRSPAPAPIQPFGYPLRLAQALSAYMMSGVGGAKSEADAERQVTRRRANTAIRISSTSSKASESTPEKRWHTLDFTVKYDALRLLSKIQSDVAAEMLKREGGLTASTAEERFKDLKRSVSSLRDAPSGSGVASAAAAAAAAGDGDAAGDGGADAPPGTTDAVRVYGGFRENADRLLFPYGDMFKNGGGESAQVFHMTILKNGVIENPKKRLYLGGVFDDEHDRADLETWAEKELRKELKARTDQATVDACQDKDKAALVSALMGKERETNLEQRALCAFPFLQTMAETDSRKHVTLAPNNVFVQKRENGSFGVTHCWPVKYNKDWQKNFINHSESAEYCTPYNAETGTWGSLGNPDESRFSPRAAAEFAECMARLFPSVKGARRGGGGGLLSRLCPGKGPEDEFASRVIFAERSSWNKKTILVGEVEDLITYLRVRPKLREYMGIVCMLPFGFVAGIVVKGSDKGTKQFRMSKDDGQQCVYIKQGYETMACCKPLDLFNVDCKFGLELKDTTKPAGQDPHDETTEDSKRDHEQPPEDPNQKKFRPRPPPSVLKKGLTSRSIDPSRSTTMGRRTKADGPSFDAAVSTAVNLQA